MGSPVTRALRDHGISRKALERLRMPRRRARKARTGRGRRRPRSAFLVVELHYINQRLKAIEDFQRQIALVVKASKPSVVLRPYLQDDLEHDLATRFLDGQTHRTPELGTAMRKDRRQVLRIIRRINRRIKRAEGVEPFFFDPATRTWQLGLEIIDRKEMQ